MKLNEKEMQAVKEYIEQVNKLKGVPSQNKGLQNGRQIVIVKSVLETKSKSGKPMMKLELVNQEHLTKNFFYVMHNDKTYDKLQHVKTGDLLDVIISGVGGFLRCQMLKQLDSDVELPAGGFMNVTNVISYDVEVFKFDWSVVFEDVLTGKQFKVENSLNKLKRFFQKHENNIFIGYNSAGYDKHILKAILDGKQPYEVSKEIIDGERGSTQVYRMYNGSIINLAEVDLYQDNKGFSLKEHNAFNGLEIKETDIDFDIDRKLTDEEREQNIYYNGKDVEGTTKRFIQMIGALKTKAMLCEMYDLDYTWLFKTNATLIGEILKAKWHDDRGDLFDKYEKPDWITFNNPDILEQVNEWILEKDKIPKIKKTKNGESYWTTDLKFTLHLRDLDIELGSGGLHGAIKNYIKRGARLLQADVGSLFPNTMVLHNYISRNIPKKHVHMYSDILKERMQYKHAGEKAKEQALKLVLNTKYGVLRAKFNPLYDPRMAVNVNITGQLAMLDLADKIEPYAFISAMNTDSINYEPYDDECEKKIDEAKQEWCERSGYELDTDIIIDIAQANVNNYVCRFDNGKVKTKGAISMGGGVKWSKAIVYKAVQEYFMSGTPIRETIEACEDLRDFQIISKTGWTYQETRAYVNEKDYNVIQKVNRSFAVKDTCELPAVKIRKYKEAELLKRPKVEDFGFDEENKDYKKAVVEYNDFKTLINEWAKEFGKAGAIEHWKKTKGQVAKSIPSEPENYVISNENIEESPVKISDIDFDYYVAEAQHMVNIYEGTEDDDFEEGEE